MDTPYYIETARDNGGMVYDIYKSTDGRICRVYDFANARLVVEALNKIYLERAIERVT